MKFVFVIFAMKSFLHMFTCFLVIVTSRIINPIETNQIYPWMVFLLRQERKLPNEQKDSMPSRCTGAVLSKR